MEYVCSTNANKSFSYRDFIMIYNIPLYCRILIHK